MPKQLKDYLFLSPTQFYAKTRVELCRVSSSCGASAGAVSSFNGRTGAISLTEADVTDALGYTPVTASANLLIAATDASGNIVDGVSNVISRTLTGFVTGANSTIVAGDTILGALQKAQGQLNGKINNQTTLQTGAAYNVTRGIITQAAGGTVSTQFPTNQVDAFTVTGGKGASTTFAGTATAARGGQVNMTSGAGGDLSASATGGTGGNGGQLRLLGGNGGNAVSAGTAAGDGGLVEIQGGDAGVSSGGAAVGNAGYVSMKAGNAAITGNGDGGHVYIISGLNNGTGRVGGMFMGLSPSNQRRGTVFMGCLQGDFTSSASTDILYVKGQAKFVDTPVKGVDAINSDEFTTLSQVNTLVSALSVSGSSPTLTFDPVPANGFLDLGYNLSGAAIGDAVALGVPAAAQVNGVVFTAMVSNTNVITIRCHNFTGSPISVPGGVFKATVFK